MEKFALIAQVRGSDGTTNGEPASLFGFDDIGIFAPPDIAAAEQTEDVVTLVGDAEAFLYRIPTNRLKYRTVFDIPGKQKDMWSAWTGTPESQAIGTIILNPMEVIRLSKTYLDVPSLPADYRADYADDHAAPAERAEHPTRRGCRRSSYL